MWTYYIAKVLHGIIFIGKVMSYIIIWLIYDGLKSAFFYYYIEGGFKELFK